MRLTLKSKKYDLFAHIENNNNKVHIALRYIGSETITNLQFNYERKIYPSTQ